jgi:hypothetical protein
MDVRLLLFTSRIQDRATGHQPHKPPTVSVSEHIHLIVFANQDLATQQSNHGGSSAPSTSSVFMLAVWAYETRREELSMAEWLELNAVTRSPGSG